MAALLRIRPARKRIWTGRGGGGDSTKFRSLAVALLIDRSASTYLNKKIVKNKIRPIREMILIYQ